MDLFKELTGKNPKEYEHAAKVLVDTPDVELFKKLVKQEDFLFDFVKSNVAKRIQNACSQKNYLNLLEFFDYYSPSYDMVIAEVLYKYGGLEILPQMKEFFYSGNNENKAYSVKYFSHLPEEYLNDLISDLRITAKSNFEPLSTNSIEILSKVNDNVSKNEAIENLSSKDEFEQYNAVKFLVTYGAKDAVYKIIEVMKNSSLSENIASEIPYLVPIEELIACDFDGAMLVLCNIVNAIPEIIPASVVIEYNFFDIFENLYCRNLTSTSALLLRISKDKFNSLTENEEYLFDCDRNTKEEVGAINRLLSGVNKDKLDSLLYEELYDESDFVFFALDYVDSIEELETLLDSKNQTLLLKVLTLLKEKRALNKEHKTIALENIVNDDIKEIIEVL